MVGNEQLGVSIPVLQRTGLISLGHHKEASTLRASVDHFSLEGTIRKVTIMMVLSLSLMPKRSSQRCLSMVTNAAMERVVFLVA